MIISQTPLRISLLGGGTDFRDFYEKEDGFVLSTAIDKYVFVILKGRYDEMIYVNYSKKERVKFVDEIEHELVREAMKKAGVSKGIEITMLADIPSEGSGLGSSSSLTVGLLNALYIFNGKQITAEQLAQEACDIEIEICKKPIGKQDQYIAAYGGVSTFTFQKSGKVISERLDLMSENIRVLGSNLLLYYTGKTRSANIILKEQKENTSNGSIINSLTKIRDLAFKGNEAVINGDFNEVGRLINKNWEFKKGLASNIENDDISKMYDAAMSAGALGAKISGAGGGGFLMVYCERENQNKLRIAMKGFKEMPFMLEQDGSKIIFNYRSYSYQL